MKKIIAACGNDCAACPRYVAHPYEKMYEELRHTADLWMKIGYLFICNASLGFYGTDSGDNLAGIILFIVSLLIGVIIGFLGSLVVIYGSEWIGSL